MHRTLSLSGSGTQICGQYKEHISHRFTGCKLELSLMLESELERVKSVSCRPPVALQQGAGGPLADFLSENTFISLSVQHKHKYDDEI